MNTEQCGDCDHFWPLKRREGKSERVKDLNRGYCLKRTIFPKNKPGNPVYPPRAIVQDLPYNRAKTLIVKNKEIVPHCNDFARKK